LLLEHGYLSERVRLHQVLGVEPIPDTPTPKVDDYYCALRQELDATKRKALAQEFRRVLADNMYVEHDLRLAFYMVGQPWHEG